MKDEIKLKISRKEEIINYEWKSINCANYIQKIKKKSVLKINELDPGPKLIKMKEASEWEN